MMTRLTSASAWLWMLGMLGMCLEAQAVIPYLNGSKYGYCTPEKKVVIPPKYDYAWPFHEGLAWVYLNGKRGLIDSSGREVVPPKYDDAGAFQEGLAWAKLNGKEGYVDRTGREVVPPKYDEVGAFQEGLAMVTLNDKRFYIMVFPDGRVVEYYDE